METIMGQTILTMNVGKCFQQSHLKWVPSYILAREVSYSTQAISFSTNGAAQFI